MKENSNGITMQELKEFIRDMLDYDDDWGQPFTIWVGDGKGYSNECVELRRLNAGDLLLEIRKSE